MLSLYFLLPLCLVALCLVVLATTRWGGFRRLLREARRQAGVTIAPEAIRSTTQAASISPLTPPLLSVVVTSEGHAHLLEQTLPVLLQQDFPHYEVIVADAAVPEDETAELVLQLQQQHKHLRYTAMPQHHSSLQQHKFLLTLGIRAARAEWVVLIAPDCTPVSAHWLRHLHAQCSAKVHAVAGYANYDTARGAGLRAHWQRLLRFARVAEGALRGKALGADACNVVLRKSWFIEQHGFVSSLDLPYGECELLLHQCVQQPPALALHPEAAVQQILPEARLLREERRQAAHLHTRLKAQKHWVFCREGLASLALYVGWLSWWIFLAMRLYYFFPAYLPQCLQPYGLPHSATGFYTLIELAWDAPAALLLLLLLLLPLAAQRALAKAFNEPPVGIYAWGYELLQPWRKSW